MAYDHFLKQGFEYSLDEVDSGLNFLEQNGLIEIRAIGKDSYSMLEATKASNVNDHKVKDSKGKNEEKDETISRYPHRVIFFDYAPNLKSSRKHMKEVKLPKYESVRLKRRNSASKRRKRILHK